MNAWEDEEERGDGRSEPLLVENAGRSKRKSTSDQPPLTHLSLDFRYTKRARYQHLSNLVTCMRHFEATKEDGKLALVLATMLQAENPDSINLHWQFRSKPTHSRLSEVLLSAYRLLSRHPDVASIELQKRLLQRASPYQVSPEGSFAVQLELGRFLYLHSNALADAYDLLVSLSKTPDSKVGRLLETERLSLLAQIRIDQLQESLGRVHGRNAYSLLRSYSPQLWSAGGRTVRQLYDDAQSFITAAIDLQPHRIETSIVSMALFWSKGQKEAARKVADKIPFATKDKDAIAIKLALAVERFDAVKDNLGQLLKLLEHSSDLLRIDPQCHASLKVLIYAGHALTVQGSGLPAAQVSRASKLMLHGLCNYIGASKCPTFAHRALYFEAWHVLRTLVIKILNRFLKCHREYCQTKTDNDHAFSFPQLKAHWAAQKKIDQDLITFHQVVDYGLKQIARNRLDIGTLLSRSVVELKTWVAAGTLDIRSVSDMLVIRYASELSLMTDSRKKLYAQRLGGLDVPNIHYPGWGNCENLDASTNVSCLHEWLKSELEPSAKLIATVKELEEHVSIIKESYCRAQHVQDQALYALGALVSLQKIPDYVDHHWTPYGINAVHPELGAFASPPSAWWTVFPQVRRREQRARPDEVDLANRSTLNGSRPKRVRFQDLM